MEFSGCTGILGLKVDFLATLAVKSAKSVKGRIVGVDIIPDQNGNLWVLEANATPGWAGLQQVTDFDISQHIADVLSRK